VVPTPGYGVSRIVFSQDGSLWAAVAPMTQHPMRNPNTMSSAATILPGKQIGSYLPRNTYESKRQSPASESFSAASGETCCSNSLHMAILPCWMRSGKVVNVRRYASLAAEIYGMAFTKAGRWFSRCSKSRIRRRPAA